ncbi:TIGR04197 family type VII secretion effector [Pueribacillus sp. YX66]|uniref:TIGR04197 family type VII secretion effector n=1 Tax=Pueribacillus sp. YX66 TaxID=3229242 RepID=UPI00358CF13E
MYEVQSSHSQVQQIVNEMENVIQSITGVKQNVETANRTTVSGNETAKTTINEHKSMMIQLMNVFKQDVERLQTIALEFNRTDVEAANMYRKLI